MYTFFLEDSSINICQKNLGTSISFLPSSSTIVSISQSSRLGGWACNRGVPDAIVTTLRLECSCVQDQLGRNIYSICVYSAGYRKTFFKRTRICIKRGPSGFNSHEGTLDYVATFFVSVNMYGTLLIDVSFRTLRLPDIGHVLRILLLLPSCLTSG